MPPSRRGPDRRVPRTKPYRLLGADGRTYLSADPGLFGGHRRSRIYGRLDCRAARRAIPAGGYVTHRVFFADEATAIAAGYRPCAVCMRAAYRAWKTDDHRRDLTQPERRLSLPATRTCPSCSKARAPDARLRRHRCQCAANVFGSIGRPSVVVNRGRVGSK